FLPDLDRNEIVNVLVNVLLHGVPPVDPSADLRVDLVPRATDLRPEIATKRLQILIQIEEAVARTHAETHGSVQIVAEAQRCGVRPLARPRPLYEYFVHVLAHTTLELDWLVLEARHSAPKTEPRRLSVQDGESTDNYLRHSSSSATLP